MTQTNKKQIAYYEYSVLKLKYTVLAENKLTAYAAMISHFWDTPNLIVIHEPITSKKDVWINPDRRLSAKKIDEVFGGSGSFKNYLKDNRYLIRECFKSRVQLV